MNRWKSLVLICLLFALVFALGAGFGFVAESQRAANAIAAARSDTAVCASAAEAQTAALDELQAKLQAQAKQLDAVRAVAQMALDARDALQKKLEKQARERAYAVTRAAHANPECADLAHLPVCPAVAERLWGAHASAGAPADH